MKKEIRIRQIMDSQNVNRQEAEQIFIKEICSRYFTKDIRLAESMYNTSQWRYSR